MEKIKEQLEQMGYDYAVAIATKSEIENGKSVLPLPTVAAVAIATKSEIENGAACGQLSIIVETE